MIFGSYGINLGNFIPLKSVDQKLFHFRFQVISFPCPKISLVFTKVRLLNAYCYLTGGPSVLKFQFQYLLKLLQCSYSRKLLQIKIG